MAISEPIKLREAADPLADERFEERLREVLQDAFPAADPSDALRRRVAEAAARQEARLAARDGSWWDLARIRLGLKLVRIGMEMAGMPLPSRPLAAKDGG